MMFQRVSSLSGRVSVLALVLLALIASPAPADTLPVPALTGRVVDQANVLNNNEENRLATKLQDLEAKTSIQLVVVTLPGLQGRPIEEWGLTLGRTWGIGQKDKDTGVLLVVAPNDRELRIEVGYGLEGTLPDATADAIIRNVIVPRFKNGSMAGGISDGVDAIIATLTGTGEEFVPSRQEAVGQWFQRWSLTVFVVFFVLLMMLGQYLRDRRKSNLGDHYYRDSSGTWRDVDDDGRRSGRSFGGGRSGGFSGGGGSFGGGGASGRW